MTEGKLFVETDGEKCETESIITDMFCTGCDLQLTDAPIAAERCNEVTMLAAVRDIVPSEELKAKRIFDTSVKISAGSVSVSGGEITVSGKANAEMLVLKNDGTYASESRSIPFTYSGAWDKETPSVTAEAKGVSAVLTGIGDAEIHFTAALNAKTRPAGKESCITNAEVAESGAAPERPSLVVYFTKPGDTLWNIAKRYGVTQKNIIGANSLGDTLPEGQRIIIPR